MTQSSSLEHTLKTNLPMNAARIKCLSKILLALLKTRTVNLVEIASVFESKASLNSRYRRIRRFFAAFDFCYLMFATFLLRLMEIPKPYVLTMDRTDWQFGKYVFNILVLGVAFNGAAIPVFWILLPKKGNSNTKERIDLITRFCSVFGVDSIDFLCGDREFIGEEWFRFLLNEDIDFRIRIRNNTKIANKKGKACSAKSFFKHLPQYQPYVFKKAKRIWGVDLYVSGMKLKEGEYLIVVSGKYSGWALEEYGMRWEIETLFGFLKSRGFRLEETHLTKEERVSRLLMVLAIGFCWVQKIGEWLAQEKPLKVKKHGRLEKSVFRYGFDFLREVLINFQPVQFKRLVSFLSCT